MGEDHLTECSGVPAHQLAQAWPHVEEYLRTALSKGLGEYSLREVQLLLAKEKLQLWVVGDTESLEFLGAFVTQVDESEVGKFLNIFLCAGEDFDDWIHHLTMVEAWGREQGCIYSKVYGRRGWKKKLAPYGYAEKYVVLRKKLFEEH